MHIHTHYDNLQLPQTATDAEIRQAYRRLSKRYHPDLNADPDAHRIMQLINRAYEVLSDPSSRAEHDRWIRAQYRRQYEVMPQPITYYYAAEAAAPPAKPALRQTKLLLLLSVLTLLLTVLAFWLGLGWLQRPPPAPVAAPPNAQPIHINIGVQGAAAPDTVPPELPPAPAADYNRPAAAPNGSAWPEESGYIHGYPIISGTGSSTIYADNVRNSSDVFARLYEKHNPQPLRTFFLQERSELPLNNLDTGEYFIRYQQLDNGEFLDSESIAVSENGQKATIYLQRGKAPAPKLHD